MIPFELAEPTSLAAAITLLDPDDPTIRPIAGGTALMLMMKAGVFHPTKLDQSAQDREQVFEHQRRAERASHRRDDDASGARTVGRSPKACAGHHSYPADAVERARTQRRDHRRRARPCRSSYGPAAGADRARRDADRQSDRKVSGNSRSRNCSPAITRRCWSGTS